jgi:hypothetical protein
MLLTEELQTIIESGHDQDGQVLIKKDDWPNWLNLITMLLASFEKCFIQPTPQQTAERALYYFRHPRKEWHFWSSRPTQRDLDRIISNNVSSQSRAFGERVTRTQRLHLCESISDRLNTISAERLATLFEESRTVIRDGVGDALP